MPWSPSLYRVCSLTISSISSQGADCQLPLRCVLCGYFAQHQRQSKVWGVLVVVVVVEQFTFIEMACNARVCSVLYCLESESDSFGPDAALGLASTATATATLFPAMSATLVYFVLYFKSLLCCIIRSFAASWFCWWWHKVQCNSF